jgi:Tfp pilus assembly protein PilV
VSYGWIIVLLVVGVVVFAAVKYQSNINAQNRQFKQQAEQNSILRQQCISDVEAREATLYQQAVANHTATQDYVNKLNEAKDVAVTNCDLKY